MAGLRDIEAFLEDRVKGEGQGEEKGQTGAQKHNLNWQFRSQMSQSMDPFKQTIRTYCMARWPLGSIGASL